MTSTDRSVDIPGGIVIDGALWPVRFDPAIGKFVAVVHGTRITEETWSNVRLRVAVEATRAQAAERTAAIRRVARVGATMRDLATLTGTSREHIRRVLADTPSPAQAAELSS
jgi:hypothetical protein